MNDARETAVNYGRKRIDELRSAFDALAESDKPISHIWLVNENLERAIRRAESDDPILYDDWRER